MSFHPRTIRVFPAWQDFEAALSRALAARLGSESFGAALPEILRQAPAIKRPRPGFPGPKKLLKTLALALLWLHLAYISATSLLILSYRFADPSVTVLMAYRKWGYGWKLEPPLPLALAKTPAYVKSMLVAIEDDKFYEHHGISMEAFARAREINKRLGRPLYGGSTLTMQLARTLFLVPEKSYLRKYVEVLTAFELELFLPKKRILELYFGYAEWGKGIFGMEAAARHWYGRGVARLSRVEAARLMALLSSPIRYNPNNLERSAILRERYSYLYHRYVASRAPVANEAVTPANAAAAAVPPAVDQATAPTTDAAAPPASSAELAERAAESAAAAETPAQPADGPAVNNRP